MKKQKKNIVLIDLNEELRKSLIERISQELQININKLIMPALMTEKKVAAYLHLGRNTVRRLVIREKDFPKPIKTKKIVRYSKLKIDEWIEKKLIQSKKIYRPEVDLNRN
jgi:predicted DNA-binding transcriptional regulator AlpA